MIQKSTFHRTLSKLTSYFVCHAPASAFDCHFPCLVVRPPSPSSRVPIASAGAVFCFHFFFLISSCALSLTRKASNATFTLGFSATLRNKLVYDHLRARSLLSRSTQSVYFTPLLVGADWGLRLPRRLRSVLSSAPESLKSGKRKGGAPFAGIRRRVGFF